MATPNPALLPAGLYVLPDDEIADQPLPETLRFESFSAIRLHYPGRCQARDMKPLSAAVREAVSLFSFQHGRSRGLPLGGALN